MAELSSDGGNDGWGEYRRLVLDLLERHDHALERLETKIKNSETVCVDGISKSRKELRDLVDEKFVLLGQMHQRQVENAKLELVQAIKKAAEEDSEIKVTKVTKQWDFWMQVVISLTALGTALIALFSK
jgi:hypothetical protein